MGTKVEGQAMARMCAVLKVRARNLDVMRNEVGSQSRRSNLGEVKGSVWQKEEVI